MFRVHNNHREPKKKLRLQKTLGEPITAKLVYKRAVGGEEREARWREREKRAEMERW